MRTQKLSFWIVLGLLAGLFLKLFVIDILHVSGNSMVPALKNGSSVVVNKLAYGLNIPFQGKFFFQWKTPETDDLVIFLHENKMVVKRCVATGGDLLDFSDDSQYNLTVNDRIIPLNRVEYERLSQFKQVPEGFVLVLGDNLPESIDSRSYGFISVKNITGKIISK